MKMINDLGAQEKIAILKMESPNLTAEKDFLFVIEIKNEVYYNDQNELSGLFKVLPKSVRIYAIIHAGMNTLKIYCITNNISDYESVAELTGAKTVLVDTNSSKGPRIN